MRANKIVAPKICINNYKYLQKLHQVGSLKSECKTVFSKEKNMYKTRTFSCIRRKKLN